MSCFSGKKAVVIGGSGGIGKALSYQLVCSGASLCIQGGHDSPEFTGYIEKLKNCSVSADTKISREILHFDAENFTDLCRTKLAEILDGTDILCVCFGPFLQKSLDKTTLEEWQRIALLDYALPGYCTSTVLPYMIRKRWGRILLFGGTRTYSLQAFRTNAAYAGAKTAVCSLVRSIACEYGDKGITCNALLPGFTNTEYLDNSEKAVLAEKMPGGTLITPESVAVSGMMLLENENLNGVLLNIDRGWNP